MSVHFSSKSHLWETPQHFFDMLDNKWGFTLDVCATKQNAKCAKFFTEKDNGLTKKWTGVCWMNPPYGREIGEWMEKAVRSCVEDNATVVCLVPARTDTKWWHTYAIRGEVQFIRGRLRFGWHKNSAPFPSAVVVFHPGFIRGHEK
tara:strand:- start:51 stop:488 length:438 start_codon:yes stop_codon:yes gene_type:complete